MLNVRFKIRSTLLEKQKQELLPDFCGKINEMDIDGLQTDSKLRKLCSFDTENVKIILVLFSLDFVTPNKGSERYGFLNMKMVREHLRQFK